MAVWNAVGMGGVLAACLASCSEANPTAESSRERTTPGAALADAGQEALAAGDAQGAPAISAAAPDAASVSVESANAASASCGLLRGRVRDFRREHPDFERRVDGHVVPGIVMPMLGPDRKPVVNASVATSVSVTRFEDWYVDVPGVNEPFETEIDLSGAGAGRFVFESDAFFPLDGRGFGNEYLDHNFHFTTEIHTRFVYRPGDQFTFSGDDDLWLFINDRLAIDLGGVHNRETKTVNLDAQAAELGITAGGSYAMDIFHAERHTSSSNFRIETTIECLEPVVLL
jgi:fibro-slime domain-containing protein